MIKRLAILVVLAQVSAHAVDLNTLPTNSWVETQPDYVGAPNGGSISLQGWNNKGAYDPASKRVIVFERWFDTVHNGSIYANSVLAFDPASNTVTVLKVGNWTVTQFPTYYQTFPMAENATDPTPVDRHPLGCVALATDFNRLYIGNGLNSSAAYNGVFGTAITDTWCLDLSQKKWTFVSDLNSPSRNPDYSGPQVMTYDPANKVIVFFDNSFSTGSRTWLLNPATNTWSTLPADPSAMGVYTSGAAIAYDTKRSRVITLGAGLDSTDQYLSRKLWSYSVAENKWTRLADCPVDAPMPGFDYDSNHDVFLALIGNQTYAYHPVENTWELINAPINRPANYCRQSVTYDAAHDVFVYQGITNDNPRWVLFRYASGNTAPFISQHPANKSVSVGQDATFTVLAGGSPAPTYQWQRLAPGAGTFVDVPGAVSANYTRTASAGDDGSQFRCVVTNRVGSITSNAATLTVTGAPAAPVITTQPANASVIVGQTATFTVVATGAGTLTYQWQRNNADIPGATSASYSTPAAALSDSGSTYRCLITNAGGTVTSNNATLNVSLSTGGNHAPVIQSIPMATPNPALVGQTVIFSVTASDPDHDVLTYVWSFGDELKSALGSHAYAAAGHYTATVTVTDPSGASATDNVVVVVTDGGAGGGSGGSGGTGGGGGGGNGGGGGGDGGGGTPPNTVSFTVTALQGIVRFDTTAKDKIALKGTLSAFPLPFQSAGQSVTIDAGGARADFVLGASGKARSNSGTFALNIRAGKSKGRKSAGTEAVAFSAQLKNGTWAQVWNIEPQRSAAAVPMTMAVTIELAGIHYAADVNATYTSKAQRSAFFKK